MQDKKAIMHVLAGLIKNPEILGRASEYKITVDDFPEKFHKIVFATIHNLYNSGVESITPIEIDGYLSNYDNQYRIFNDNNGVDFLFKIAELSDEENFDFHYERLKKYSFLRDCESKGININDIYDKSAVDLKEIEEQQERLDSLSLEELIKTIEMKVLELKNTHSFSNKTSGERMGENVKEVLEDALQNPDYGAPLNSLYLNAIVRGARRKKFYLRSAESGGGKTRQGIGDLLRICATEIYNIDTKEWEKTGNTGKGLFITTELESDEIRIPALCYISGVQEDKILEQTVTKEEISRLEKASEILDNSPIWIEYLSDFDLVDIDYTIERNIIQNDVEYVVFDYIHPSIKLLSSIASKSGVSIREDQVLLLMASGLKELANKYDVWILSSTQLNNAYKNEGVIDASTIRGGKATVDKTDAAMVTLEVTEKHEKMIKPILSNGFYPSPTHVTVMFKNRRGRWNKVMIWQQIDLGNMRTKDCFVTDHGGRLLDIKPKKIETITA